MPALFLCQNTYGGAGMRVCLSLFAALAVVAGAGTQRQEFEVASVKISPGAAFEFVPTRSGDRVSIHMTHIFSVIAYAYRITGTYQVIGYPEDYTWYDIDAKIGRDATDDEVRLMFQSLLEDRFQFKAHHETRELPEFQLTVPKGKARMTASTSDEPMKLEIEGRKLSQPKGTCGVSGWNDGAHLICHAAPMEAIIAPISGNMHAPVADHTGLTGTYDLNLVFVAENAKLRPDGPSGPSLNEALQSELGLKLEKGKGPVEVLVIDHIQKASAN